MKKKIIASLKDKQDWEAFTKNMGDISVKVSDLPKQGHESNIVPKLDLHGLSLSEANKEVEKFILKSFKKGIKKILIVTGKGLHSKSYDNPYVSEKFSILKNAVPDYIYKDKNLATKISKIVPASIEDGGAGAINVFLKKK